MHAQMRVDAAGAMRDGVRTQRMDTEARATEQLMRVELPGQLLSK
jgi:hypothetical protein